MKLGRAKRSEQMITDEGNYSVNGWLDFRAVGAGRHFHGYIKNKEITHGHVDPLPAGMASFYIQGSGRLLIDDIKVLALGE
jgi:hypothetical protein